MKLTLQNVEYYLHCVNILLELDDSRACILRTKQKLGTESIRYFNLKTDMPVIGHIARRCKYVVNRSL